ncbi:MAG: histidine kinase [Terrimicrobiaceae bacterium]|nr:histidine kinase [Terrimicrobiaceae bacterium]
MKSWNYRLSLFWKFQLAGWVVLVIAAFPLKYAMAGSFRGALLLSAARDGGGFLLTLGLRAIYRKFWSDKTLRMAGIISVACMAGGGLQYALAYQFFDLSPDKPEIFYMYPARLNAFYERAGLLFGWSFLYFGIRHALASKERELRLALIESEKRQAQLQMLRAQMNPHFLFNALNTIRNGVEKANAQLGSTVESLADFLRFSLDHASDDFIPLGREFDAMQNYLRVEKARFRGKLEYECHIDENARAVPAPGIVLQPLVENAIKYGQDTSVPPLRVRVQVLRQADAFKIVVANTGDWLEPAPREKASHIGLENLRRRLELLYPRRHLLEITPVDGWVTITIHLPVL